MKQHHLHWYLVLAAIALAVGAAPAAADELTLTKALTLARSNAPEIAAAEARVEASKSRLRQARAYRLPGISLQEIWMRTDSPAEAFALQLNQERFSFPDFVSSDPNDPRAIESATTRLQVSLPLYTGGELSSRIRQADLASQAARDTALWAGNGAVFAAAEAYVHLIQAREYVSLLERSLETIDAHVALARAYTEQGMLVKSELLRAEVERARIQDFVTSAQGRARVAAANLSFRLATVPDSEWALAPLPSPNTAHEPLEYWLQTAESRSDLAAARRLLQAGELESRVKRAAMMPRLGLVARHDLVDDSLFGDNGDSTAIMAVGSIDLWGGGRHRAAVRAARSDVEAARHEVEQFARAVTLDVEDAWEQTRTAVERHGTAVQAKAAAAEAERITTERFGQGVVKMIDLLDAATARREAEMRELVARADAHLAHFRLAFKAGRQPETALHLTDGTLPTETAESGSSDTSPTDTASDKE